MIAPSRQTIPEDILRDSVLANIAAAWFAIGKKLERRTGCSATRGFILSLIRNGADLNQNQIANHLDLDRTVVHRAVRTMIAEGLVSEEKGKSGRSLLLRLTPLGKEYRARLIAARRDADAKVSQALTSRERETLTRTLKTIAGLDL